MLISLVRDDRGHVYVRASRNGGCGLFLGQILAGCDRRSSMLRHARLRATDGSRMVLHVCPSILGIADVIRYSGDQRCFGFTCAIYAVSAIPVDA
jgi:hypothetical protein